jgi:hypothetical protein
MILTLAYRPIFLHTANLCDKNGVENEALMFMKSGGFLRNFIQARLRRIIGPSKQALRSCPILLPHNGYTTKWGL